MYAIRSYYGEACYNKTRTYVHVWEVSILEIKISETMSVMDKLGILSDAAKYDVACTSSGVDRQGSKGGIGNARNNFV